MTRYVWSAISLYVGVNVLVAAGWGRSALLWSLLGALSLVLSIVVVEAVRRNYEQ